ncbi:MAG: AAA family ATPase, partial [Pseudomonadota bacterium]
AHEAADMLRDCLGEAEAKAALYKLLPNVHGGVVNRLWDAHGASAVAVIRENPYSATRCYGIGWLTADALAGSIGITGDDRRRVSAGIDEALRFAELSGHTGLPSSEFSGAATRLLGEDCAGAIKEVANSMLAAGELRAEVGFADGSRLIQRSAQADLEIEIAEQLAALRAAVDVSEARNWVPEISPETTIPEAMSRLSEEQFAAVGFILSEGIGIITGGPGTGKTYCLQSLIECAPLARWLLVAPTGKAARVMADRVGREAKTIHSALEPDPVGTDMDKGQWKFKRDAKRPFDADIIVCDEASMIDHALAHAFLAAIPRGAWLVILGDADQLPSVGAGDFLRSICDTEILPVHRLTEIHRAAAASRGVAACHAIIKGQSPIPCRTDSGPATPAERNFWLIKCPAEQIPAMAGKLVGEWGPAHGIDTADAVCLSANSAKRGAVCAPALNAHLQEVVNPGGKPITQIDPRAEVPWRIGDRLVQTRNDYATGLVNGELVTLVRADNFGGNPIIRTDDGREIAVKGDADGIALQLAYALTVHKFQGSEARLVVVCLDWNSQRMVVNRNWLYTALSRFRDFVFVLTPRPQDVAKTIEKPGDARYTGLAARMICHVDSAQKRKALADYEDCMIPF